MQPRFFFRRLAAVLIDMAFVSLLLLVISIPLHWAGLRIAPFGVKILSCQTLPDPVPPQLADAYAKAGRELPTIPAPVRAALDGHEIAGFSLCRISSFGLNAMTSMTVVYDVTPKGNMTQRKRLTVALDDSATRIVTVWPVSPLILALYIGMLGDRHRRGKRSPGEAALGLRLHGPGRRFFLREVLKLAPFVIGAVVELLLLPLQTGNLAGTVAFMDRVAAAIAGSFAPFLIIPLVLILAMGWWYDWFWLRWRGRARYDRICDMEMRRA